MSTDPQELTIDDVLEPREVEELGEPVKVYPVRSLKPVGGVESRNFDDPDTTALTGSGFNMAKELRFNRSSDSENELNEDVIGALDEFAREFGREGENAIYVRDKVLEYLEEDKASAFMKFQGIDYAYPVTMHSHEDLEQEIENSKYKFDETYLDAIESRIHVNNFIVPVIYANNSYFPESVPVTVVHRPEDGFVFSPDDPSVKAGVDDFDKGAGGFSDHPHIEYWAAGEDYELIIDCIGAGIDSPSIEISEDEIIVYDGEEEFYRAKPDTIDLEEKPDGLVEGTLTNGVYDVRF